MRISVVIPALDEVESIGRAIESTFLSSPLLSSVEGALGAGSITETKDEIRSRDPLAPRAPAEAPALEICVVDGGSRDGTVAAAREAGDRIAQRFPEARSRVRVLEWGSAGTPGGPAGRARQLQAGVEATQGDVLVMLHADTLLPEGWANAIGAALESARNAGGAFRFSFAPTPTPATAGERWALWLVEWGARIRVAALRQPYGDQALFVRRSVLMEAGGLPQVKLMEDLDLVRIIKQAGRLVLLADPVRTSPRRHLDGGVLRTAWLHIAAGLAHGLGVDRDRIAGWLGR